MTAREHDATSGFGTEQTSRDVRCLVAVEAKADTARTSLRDQVDPTATLLGCSNTRDVKRRAEW
jgi:hypothetical protein